MQPETQDLDLRDINALAEKILASEPPAPPEPLLTENEASRPFSYLEQQRALEQAPKSEHVAGRDIDTPKALKERADDLPPPADPGAIKRPLPVLELTGDPAVRKEFFDRLQSQGRLHKDPENPGRVIMMGSIEQLARDWQSAATAVARRESRQVIGSLVHQDKRSSEQWPGGGAVFGAAGSYRELHRMAARELVAGLPSYQTGAKFAQIVSNPRMLLCRDGTVNRDGIDQLLQLATQSSISHPGQRLAQASGRTATVGECARYVAALEYLSKLASPETAALAQGVAGKMEASALRGPHAELFKQLKSDELRDIASSHKSAVSEIARELLADRSPVKSSAASTQAHGAGQSGQRQVDAGRTR